MEKNASVRYIWRSIFGPVPIGETYTRTLIKIIKYVVYTKSTFVRYPSRHEPEQITMKITSLMSHYNNNTPNILGCYCSIPCV